MKKIGSLLVVLSLFPISILAKETAVGRSSEEEMSKFQRKLGYDASKYFTLPTVGKETYVLFVADVNNDGVQDYVLTARAGGSAKSDTIIEVFNDGDRKMIPLNVDNVIPEGSSMPLWFANPFIVVEKGKTYLKFTDNTIEEKYYWKGNSFKKVDSKKISAKK